MQNVPTKRKNSRTASKSKKQPGKVSAKRKRSNPGVKSKLETKTRTSSELDQPMEFAEALLVSATSAAKLEAQRREGQDRRKKRYVRIFSCCHLLDYFKLLLLKLLTHLMTSTSPRQAGANHVEPPVRVFSRIRDGWNALYPHNHEAMIF